MKMSSKETKAAPEAEGVKGFDAFMDRYMKGLGIERAAVESRIW